MSFYGRIRKVYTWNGRHGEESPAQLKSESENGQHENETAKYDVRLWVSIFQVDEDNSGAIDFDEFLRMMGNR